MDETHFKNFKNIITYSINTKENFKIRIRLKNATPEKINNWFKKSNYLSDKIQIDESINIINRNKKYDNVKIMIFEDGVQIKNKNYCCVKQGTKAITITEFDGQISYKLVCYTKEILSDTNQINVNMSNKITIKLDIVIPISELVFFHIILIKNIDPKNKSHINYLKYIVKKMFQKKIDHTNITQIHGWNICDNVILEITLSNTAISNINNNIEINIDKITNDIQSIINILIEKFCIKDEQISHQYLITEIAKYISPKLVAQFSCGKWGLKQLGCRVRPLDIVDIYDVILKNKKDYVISPKIDGKRCIVYVYNSKLYLVINSKFYKFNIEGLKLDNEIIIIADSELLESKNSNSSKEKKEIFIFDIMYCSLSRFSNILIEDSIQPFINQSQKLINKSYSFRIYHINAVINTLNKFTYINISETQKSIPEDKNDIPEDKNDIPEDKNDIPEDKNDIHKNQKYNIIFKKKPIINLNEIEDEKYLNNIMNIDVPTDGLVLTNKVQELGYHKTESWKWKPKKYSTIDLLIKISPSFSKTKNGNYIYNLMVGYSDNRKDNTGHIIKKYIPILFRPRDNPLVYNFTSKNNKYSTINLNNKIGEFYWSGKKWKLLKLRTDRDIDFQKGNYFGNDFRTAELTWQGKKNYVNFSAIYENQLYLSRDCVYLSYLFSEYIKYNIKNILIICNDIIFDKNDLYNLSKKVNQNIFILTKGYTETWIVKNIHNEFYKNKNLMNKIFICPSIMNFIKKSTKYMQEQINNMGIGLLKQSIDIIIVACKYNNVVENLSKSLGIIKYFLTKNGKVIFINSTFNENHINIFSTKKFELEMKIDKILCNKNNTFNKDKNNTFNKDKSIHGFTSFMKF